MAEQKDDVSRRRFLGTLAAATAAVPLLASCQSRPLALKKIQGRKPRNVIFIFSDDHRYDFMSFLGRPSFIETPNMDRMAKEGAHLQNAFVSTSLCSPSRATILTGQYAHNHGVVDNRHLVPEGTIFFPQYLQAAGYETAFMGKWHMGSQKDDPRPGFDHWISFRGQGVYYNPTFNIDGEKVKREGYSPDLLTDYALEWLKKKHDKPFFLYLSHKAVHALFEPAKRYEGKYRNMKPEYPRTMANTEENYRGKPHWVREQRNSYHGVDFIYHHKYFDFDTLYRRYCETILGIDDSIGRVLDYVDQSGLADNTIVFYMSDNGFSLGEHGLIDKRQMYEESMRVPLLAYAPSLVKPGSKIDQMVQNIDIAPTILEAAGLEAPSNMDGRSFLPLMRGEEIPWRDAILYEYYWERSFPQTPTVHGIRTEQYKYMRYHGLWDIDEVYDVAKDPEETHNLIESPDHQELVKELNARLWDMLEETGGMRIPLTRDRGLWQANLRGPRG